MSADGFPVEAQILVTTRPIIVELYQLDTEVGVYYYDKVVAPEARDAARDTISLAFMDADDGGANREPGVVRLRARASLRSGSGAEIAVTEVSCHEVGRGAEARCMESLERDLTSWIDGVRDRGSK